MPLTRIRRRLIVVFVVPVLLLVIVAVVLPLLIDVERYRPWIIEKARGMTGRTITMGDMSLRLLPMPALSVESVAVSEGSRQPDRDALRLRRLSVRVGIISLLRGTPAIRSLVLDEPVLVLFRDARGRWNYDDLLARGDDTGSGRADSAVTQGEGPAVRVAGARVRSGRILVYDDAIVPGRRTEAVLGPIEATFRGWGTGGPASVELAAGLGGSVLRLDARIDSAADGGAASLTVDRSRLQVADLVTLLPWLGVARVQGLSVGGELEVTGTARLPLSHPESITFAGEVRLHDVSYQDASMSAPLTGLSGTLGVDGNRAVWDRFSARIGSSTVEGQLQLEDFRKPRIGFALRSPRLDFNEVSAALTRRVPVSPNGEPTSGRDAQAPAGDAGGILDQTTGQGTLEIDNMRFQTFDLTDLSARAGLQRSVLSLAELSTSFYGGSVTGEMQVDLSGATPRYRMNAALKGIDIEPLLVDYDPALEGLLRGALSGDLTLQAAGMEMGDLTASADGSGSLEISRGTLRSFSVLGRIAALLEISGGSGIGREETPFEYLRGSFSINGGKARTEDLVLHAEDLDLEAKGWVGLDATMDLAVTARFSQSATSGMVEKNSWLASLADGDGRLAVKLEIKGDLGNPRFRPDRRQPIRGLEELQKEWQKEWQKEPLEEKLRDRLIDILGGGGDEDESVD